MSITWQIKELSTCESTFIEARKYPAWTIVNCIHQSKGRGRFNRTWFGEQGGLWVNYNLPIDEKLSCPWGFMPLVAGLALMRALQRYRIEGLRLRWPNDLLVGRHKLAGILVERPAANMLTVGIGVNMHNNIIKLHGLTTDYPVRLADLLPAACPSVQQLRDELAAELAAIYLIFTQEGVAPIISMLDSAWGSPRPVVAITDTERICGHFIGVEEDGSPILRQADGSTLRVPGITINRLKELI